MTSKERVLAALRGKNIDRLPWSPNLAYWWESQSASFKKQGEIAFLDQIGADGFIRGHVPFDEKPPKNLIIVKLKYKHSTYKLEQKKDTRIETYKTPVGSLQSVYTYSASGNTWFLTEHPVKTAEDFKILEYLKSDASPIEDFSILDELQSDLGERALIVPLFIQEMKSSFQALIEYWVGTEALVYALYDYPEIVLNTLESMRRLNRACLKVALRSNAEGFISWEDTSTTNISPDYYINYIVPEINDWCDLIHKENKFYIQHACGTLKDLIQIIGESKIDCIESISPPPTGNIELWDARKHLPEYIALIGGIEPTVFKNAGMAEFSLYIDQLLEKMEGSRYILANSDSCPPGVSLEKFMYVSKRIRQPQ
ncbi:MAG: hypothetical protein JEZ04_15675 [Spirochaetales bacterium]|nr:hypothetical protein [Spirochaetales bacterium]